MAATEATEPAATTAPKPDEPKAEEKTATANRPETRPKRQRPAGEIGGHTVQSWEEGSSTAPANPGGTSRETPAPATAQEATPSGPKGQAAPAHPAKEAPKPASSPQTPASPPASSAPSPDAKTAPTPGQVPAQANEPATKLTSEQEALVEAILASVAENLARAMRQAIVQGVTKATTIQPNASKPTR